MKTSESVQHGSYGQKGFNTSEGKPSSNFWGIAFMILIFIIVITVLALLLL